ncbi:hypothetical protein EI94DRAFT_1634117, partial [Lactarius quietus]
MSASPTCSRSSPPPSGTLGIKVPRGKLEVFTRAPDHLTISVFQCARLTDRCSTGSYSRNGVRWSSPFAAYNLWNTFPQRPSYQSQRWTISDHPEGKRYAHGKAQAGITIVTEAHVDDPGVSDLLDAWLAVICDMITEENVTIQETSHLFLEIHEASGTCNYYFADHRLCTIFWLQTIDTISVRLPDSFSSGHLQYSLEENYWNHVELFPETACQYSASALNELLVSFLHARADALTSETPTFPYSAEQSQEFIDLLQRGKGLFGLVHLARPLVDYFLVDHTSSPYVVTYVARLWATIANHRFFIHFGEDHCRLSSDQAILEVPDAKRSLVLAILSKVLLFDFPYYY